MMESDILQTNQLFERIISTFIDNENDAKLASSSHCSLDDFCCMCGDKWIYGTNPFETVSRVKSSLTRGVYLWLSALISAQLKGIF